MGAAFLFTGALQCSKAARAGAVVIGQRLGDGQLASLTTMILALLRPFGLGRFGTLDRRNRGKAARRRRCGSGRCGLLVRRGGCSRVRRSGHFLRRSGRCFHNRRGFRRLGFLDRRCSFGGLAVFLGPALFILDRSDTLGRFATARILQRVHARFLGLAQQLGLQFLTRHQALRRRLARRRRLRRTLLRRRRRGSGTGRCGCGCGRHRHRISLRRSSSRGSFARLAQDAAPLHLNHDRILAAMAELLLHLTGFHGPLDAQRLAAQNRLVFLAVTHTTELNPSLHHRPVQAPTHHSMQSRHPAHRRMAPPPARAPR